MQPPYIQPLSERMKFVLRELEIITTELQQKEANDDKNTDFLTRK